MALGAVQLTHGLLGFVITASAVGFVWWNWQPAKVFLGDVGSIPLGFLLGWLLLEILSTTYWPVAIILPLYYLADSSITLSRRIWRNERVWRAHREHFYQQATARGLSHAQVSMLICGNNILLVVLSIFSLNRPFAALCGAFIVVSGLLLILRGRKNGGIS
jgi:UDP-N-acetylmuramyl pentapeptide phosphotransferase/UDP-N-acetylglucosamine-1-phosphate transferase